MSIFACFGTGNQRFQTVCGHVVVRWDGFRAPICGSLDRQGGMGPWDVPIFIKRGEAVAADYT